MAVEPLSEKKTRVSVSAGKSPQSRSASLTAGTFVDPRNETCATRSSCAAMAAFNFG